jgi:hypothetical protein
VVSVALGLPVADGPLYVYGDILNDRGQHFYDHSHIFFENMQSLRVGRMAGAMHGELRRWG